MKKENSNKQDYFIIDFLHIARTVWHRIWIVILSGVIIGALGFCYATFLIPPKYSSSVMLYVNNSSLLGNTTFSISSSELTAAQGLVKTYTVILKNRTTINQVIEKTGLDYTYEQVYHMIDAKSVNETEVLRVTVTNEDPYEAAAIANCIAEVLPERIADVIEKSSMKVVDLGVVNTKKVAPSITNYTQTGVLLGGLAALIVLVILALLDGTVHDEEYVLKNFDYPILAKVPNLLGTPEKSYSYYYQKKKPNKE